MINNMSYINKINNNMCLIVIFIIIIYMICLSGCVSETSRSSLITIAISSDISGYDPYISRDVVSLSVNLNFFNQLVELNSETNGIVPGLAKSWTNPDNKTWRFYLRENVTFHDGSLFTSEDVKFTINFYRNLSFFTDSFSIIENINVIDQYTLEIHTKVPSPLFLYDLVLVNIFSSSYMNSVENLDEYQPIGTGPYKLSERIQNESVTIERFDEYWKNKPEIKTARFIVDEANRHTLSRLKDEEIDLAEIPFEIVNELSNCSALSIKSIQSPTVFYIGFDFRENNSIQFPEMKNPVSNQKVRNAIYYAINISEIIKKINGFSIGSPSSQFVTSQIFGYNPNIERLEYNITKAKSLMNEAGYQNGFSIKMDGSTSNRSKEIINNVADQLADINITVIPNCLSFPDYYDKLYYKNTSMYLTAFSPLTAESTILLMLHSSNITAGTGVWNYGNYSNDEVDSLYSLIVNEGNISTRNEYIKEVFSIAMKDIAWIPLYSPNRFFAVNNKFSWDPNDAGYFLINEISFN